MKRYYCIFAIMLLLLSSKSNAQYSITLEIKGSKDTLLFLGNYYLNGTYSIDSAYNKKGKFIFEDKKLTLEDGIYFFANRSGQYCEFIVDKEQKFSLATDEKDWINNISAKKSDVNKEYFAYLKETNRLGSEVKNLGKYKATMGEKEYNEKLKELRFQNDSIKEDFIKRNPNHLLSKVFNATRSVDVPEPEPIYKDDGSIDSVAMQMKKYNYYVSHYFDNIDFQCDGLLRTPQTVFHKYYETFWEDMMKYQTKDSIFSYAVNIIERARGSKLMFKFLVHDITERYLRSPYMGHDEIYINMINKYYASGDAIWMPPSSIDKEVARAKKWSNSTLLKQVPNLACPDTNDVVHDLYGLTGNYKLLIFWSYDCGHCATEIPKLYKFYKDNKDIYKLDVMAVNSGSDINQWKDKIKQLKLDWLNVNGLVANYDWHEYFDLETTPVVFLLDNQNRIIGKKIPADNIENYLKLYNEGKIKF
jgi:thiol-disulfide isomerase/thioredoxin